MTKNVDWKYDYHTLIKTSMVQNRTCQLCGDIYSDILQMSLTNRNTYMYNSCILVSSEANARRIQFVEQCFGGSGQVIF